MRYILIIFNIPYRSKIGGGFLDEYRNLLAHYYEDDCIKKQFLIDHLFEVARRSKHTGSLVGLKSSCELIGLLHDFGKSDDIFQLYIKGEYRGRVNHSSAGAKILDNIEDKVENKYNIEGILKAKGVKIRVWALYKEILQYPILAHHGLYDIIDNDFDYRTGIRLEYDKYGEYDFTGKGLNFFSFLNREYGKLNGKNIYALYYEGFIEFVEIYKKLKDMAARLDSRLHKKKALYFYYGALVRLLLAVLKDADIYDSSNYYRNHKDKVYCENELNMVWNQMGEAIENLYIKFSNKTHKSELDIIRTDLANDIYRFSQRNNKGAYKLSMPVGSGKTYAALRYSIANARKFHKSRIFYCTAFLSVLEQNSSSIKEVLGDKYVLEHHSNIVENFEKNGDEEDQKEYLVNEYLKESWESPIVLTTIVQFSNTMFKDKSSNIRRFVKLINSVIIIDEVQSLPTKVIYNFNLMTNFLTHIMNCNILHCTATQPNFDNKDALKYHCFYGYKSNESSIIQSIENSEVFDRVDYYNLLGMDLNMTLNTKGIADHIKDQLKDEMSALVVLNTKKAVSNLYNGLLEDSEIQDLDCEVIYLTTNQCPKHRLEIIEEMKKRLKDLRTGKGQKKLICVSTKLVEAGVDIDFDLVYRSLAGIDSIIQCGGRCNREGKKSSKGKLFIFEYGDENLKYLPDLKKQKIAAKSALRALKKENLINSKIDIEKACDYYFRKLFSNEEAESKYLEYPISKGDTILNLLTTNPNGTDNYRNKNNERPYFKLKQGFKTAATNFDLIKENTISVIVQYNNAKLIENLYEAIDCSNYYDIKIILKKLQPYTISIRQSEEYENYVSKELDGEIFILNREAYDEKVGLLKGELQSLIY